MKRENGISALFKNVRGRGRREKGIKVYCWARATMTVMDFLHKESRVATFGPKILSVLL